MQQIQIIAATKACRHSERRQSIVMTMRRKCLRHLSTSIRATTTGCVSTVRNSHRCVRLPVSPTLRRYAYRMCRM